MKNLKFSSLLFSETFKWSCKLVRRQFNSIDACVDWVVTTKNGTLHINYVYGFAINKMLRLFVSNYTKYFCELKSEIEINRASENEEAKKIFLASDLHFENAAGSLDILIKRVEALRLIKFPNNSRKSQREGERNFCHNTSLMHN